MKTNGSGQVTVIPETPVVSFTVENLGREPFKVIVYGSSANRDSFEVPAGVRVSIHVDDCKPFESCELISKIRLRKFLRADPAPAYEIRVGKHRDVPAGFEVLS